MSATHTALLDGKYKVHRGQQHCIKIKSGVLIQEKMILVRFLCLLLLANLYRFHVVIFFSRCKVRHELPIDKRNRKSRRRIRREGATYRGSERPLPALGATSDEQ